MLKTLAIQNFQSHEKTLLEFSEGVNVILGASDSGKTAIIRALRWLVWNRPSGEAFRSNWGGDTEVRLELEGGSVVVRGRNKVANLYTLSAFPETGAVISEFKAIKTDVPEEILHVLNLNEINLQQQLDRPFLLDASPGEVAQHFNRVAHLDVIDVGLKTVQGWLRKIEQDISTGEEHLTDLQQVFTKYEHLDELEGWVVTLEGLERERVQTINARKELEQLLTDLATTEILIEEAEEILPAEKQVDALLALCEQKKEIEGRQAALRELIYQYGVTDDKLALTKDRLAELTAEFKEAFPDVCPLCGQEVDDASV